MVVDLGSLSIGKNTVAGFLRFFSAEALPIVPLVLFFVAESRSPWHRCICL